MSYNCVETSEKWQKGTFLMSTLSIAPQRPTTNDLDAWHSYWKTQGYPWRIEPEIDEERQVYLSQRYNIKSDIKKKIYPFKDIKLTRADIEWLLTMQAKTLETAYRSGN